MFVQAQAFGEVGHDPALVTNVGIPNAQVPLAVGTTCCVAPITIQLQCYA